MIFFKIAWLAFIAVLSTASMIEVFRGSSCDETPKARTQLLYASHLGNTACGKAWDFETDMVIRAAEEPDNPDWPYCDWTFYKDEWCIEGIASLNPDGHVCPCILMPKFKSYQINCHDSPDWAQVRPPLRRRRRDMISPPSDASYMLRARNFSGPSDMMNQSAAPIEPSKKKCDRALPEFRNELVFTSGQLVRSDVNIMVDKYEVLERRDPRFVGNMFHSAHRAMFVIFNLVHKKMRRTKTINVKELKTNIELTISSEGGYLLGTASEVINPERLPRVFYVLFYTMRRQGLKAVKFQLTAFDDHISTPVMNIAVNVTYSLPV
ncbi:hypothetical protein V8C42DRAFT_348977 [Trichoderma barbatum]